MNEAAVDRQFLGWDRPLLHSVAERLVDAAEEAGTLDLSGVLVVLPGARAGRRLKELLLERAVAEGRVLRPPEVSTVGGLPERLYRAELPEPDPVLDSLAWHQALQKLDRASVRTLAPPGRARGGAPDLPAGLATTIRELHTVVASAGMSFREVSDLRPSGLGFSDRARWLVLAEAQERYRSILARHGYRDRADSRERALDLGPIHCTLHLWIVGAPDLSPVLRAFLRALRPSDPLRVLIGAPESLSDSFDALGCVIPEAWAEQRAGLPEEEIRIAQGPGGQADALIRHLAQLGEGASAEEITVGVPDPEVVPYLTERLSEHGVRARYAAGVPVERTGPFRLLADLASYLEYAEFYTLGTLLRYPALERAVLSRMDGRPPELTGSFDRYQVLHLQGLVDRGGLPAGAERPSDGLQPRVRSARDALSKLLSPMVGERPLAGWSPRLAELLIELSRHHGPDAGAAHAEDATHLAFAEAVGIVLDRFLGLPSDLDPPVPAHQAIRTLLDQIRGQEVPPEALDDAIELLGWLELPMDDAAVMVVTGFNEPHVPESVTSHPFLPHSLREAMGLLDNGGRWARDLLYLRTIRETRKGLLLVAGRWDGEGNPLLPSRLLFAEDPRSIVERVLRCFREEEPTEAGAQAVESLQRDLWDPEPVSAPATPIDRDGFRLPPEPVLSAPSPPDRIRVTEFRSLLSDPYRYALERILRLEEVDDERRELDPLGFGSLAHRVLERFGRDSASTSSDVTTIRRSLSRILEQEAASRFGTRPLAAVRLQIGQLRTRLAAFAEWQAGWVEQGWRIREVEASPAGDGAAFMVDEEPILLRGKLDRVDHNARTGQWCVLDYKTGERAQAPDASHRRGPRGAKRWVDLQLPLYRLLAASLEDEEGGSLIPVDCLQDVVVGYVAVPRDLRVREFLADWEPSELLEAEETARRVVRQLRENRFVFDGLASRIRPDEALASVVGGRVLRMSGSPDETGSWYD